MNLYHVWEREVVSMGRYLVGVVGDELLQAVVKHQLFLTSKGRNNVLQSACNILGQHELYPDLLEKWRRREQTPLAKEGIQQLAVAQAVQLVDKLTSKGIHGVLYHQTSEGEGYDTEGSFAWLTMDGFEQRPKGW